MPSTRAGALLLVCAALTGCAGSPPPASPSQPPPRSPSGQRTAGWVLVAVGAQAAAVAAGTSVMMLHSNGVRSDECDADKVCTSEGLDANGRLDQLGAWNAGAWAVAAVGLGAGLFLVLTSPSGRRVAVTPGAGGARLEARF